MELGQVKHSILEQGFNLFQDFENTDDEEEDLNDQVPPDDEEEFDEIDGDVSELDYVD